MLVCFNDIQARAAMQGGLRKGKVRERSAPIESRKAEQSTSSSDSVRYILCLICCKFLAPKKWKSKL